MFKKIVFTSLSCMVVSLCLAAEKPDWEKVKEWKNANFNNGRIGLTINVDEATAHIQFSCGAIEIAKWKPDGTEMDGVERGGPILRGDGTPVKITAKHFKNGIRLAIDKDEKFLLEPGTPIPGALCR